MLISPPTRSASCSEGCEGNDKGFGAQSGDPGIFPFIDAATDVWVDLFNFGGGNGTSEEPFRTLHKAYFGVVDGGTIHMRPGTYFPMTLEGPRSVTLTAELAAVTIGEGTLFCPD